MTEKRAFTVVLAALAIAAILLGLLAGCGWGAGARGYISTPLGGANYSSASLSEATMCKSVDAQGRPVDKTDIFSINDPKIYCSVKISNAPTDTEVKSVWIVLQGEFQGQSLTNYTVLELSGRVSGTAYSTFYASQTDGFPKGDFIVKLFLDGAEKLTVPFKVQ
jgi:hypothetical protein